MKLNRSIEAWDKCDAGAMSQMSEAAIKYAFADAKQDIKRMAAIQAQLVEDVKEILASLQAANDDCDGPITDTIWMRGARNETVFEAIENALAVAGAHP